MRKRKLQEQQKPQEKQKIFVLKEQVKQTEIVNKTIINETSLRLLNVRQDHVNYFLANIYEIETDLLAKSKDTLGPELSNILRIFTECQHDKYGNLIKDWHGAKYTYDVYGNILTESDESGDNHNITYVYDKYGRILKNSSGRTYEYVYEKDDAVTYVNEHGTVIGKIVKDIFGNITSTTGINSDGCMAYEGNEYDMYGNAVVNYVGVGKPNILTYDIFGNLLKFENSDRIKYEYVYDKLGNVIKYKRFDNCVLNITYDVYGNELTTRRVCQDNTTYDENEYMVTDDLFVHTVNGKVVDLVKFK